MDHALRGTFPRLTDVPQLPIRLAAAEKANLEELRSTALDPLVELVDAMERARAQAAAAQRSSTGGGDGAAPAWGAAGGADAGRLDRGGRGRGQQHLPGPPVPGGARRLPQPLGRPRRAGRGAGGIPRRQRLCRPRRPVGRARRARPRRVATPSSRASAPSPGASPRDRVAGTNARFAAAWRDRLAAFQADLASPRGALVAGAQPAVTVSRTAPSGLLVDAALQPDAAAPVPPKQAAACWRTSRRRSTSGRRARGGSSRRRSTWTTGPSPESRRRPRKSAYLRRLEFRLEPGGGRAAASRAAEGRAVPGGAPEVGGGEGRRAARRGHWRRRSRRRCGRRR